ncbi:hypothetical protein [Nocardiopsis suaedae]|uniref:DUF3137 domain-containing protein n=1 Tax=Nocardiopsis suaedae TaxID=3018444 RepID=A0ABT4TVF9_9ACTN|nr:hypothetical protein [Nocardiopsis suaedae]MDA2808688.1 hypothetical protein [Nocardiopsis suaedae]
MYWDLFIVLMIVAVFAIVITAFAVSDAAHAKKAKGQGAWAGRNGWRFQEKRPELAAYFTGTPFVEGGNAKYVVSGAHRGHRAMQYEYSYVVVGGGGQTTTTQPHLYRVTALETPVPTPVLEVREGGVGDVIREIFGSRGLELDDEPFDTAFRVTTTDEDFARAVLTADVRAWLLGLHAGSRFPFRFTGDHVICWETTAVGPEPDLAPADFLADLFERLPSGVWDRARRT